MHGEPPTSFSLPHSFLASPFPVSSHLLLVCPSPLFCIRFIGCTYKLYFPFCVLCCFWLGEVGGGARNKKDCFLPFHIIHLLLFKIFNLVTFSFPYFYLLDHSLKLTSFFPPQPRDELSVGMEGPSPIGNSRIPMQPCNLTGVRSGEGHLGQKCSSRSTVPGKITKLPSIPLDLSHLQIAQFP